MRRHHYHSPWRRGLYSFALVISVLAAQTRIAEAKLKAGAKVADVGCGHGASTIIMAKAYPKSSFWGLDNHEGSIQRARRACETLAADGSLLIVEPMAGNKVEENFNPVGRTFSAASTLCCTANSMALGGPALGAVATEDAIREVILQAGFKQFRRAAETPFNRVFEARQK
ncbi:MAG: methyltransferase domain-containing protein [Candidatus Omnitrophica bacterium]|nr:methyltransferase domain-containing protein [Candidatus Omnitrophota bacterium]